MVKTGEKLPTKDKGVYVVYSAVKRHNGKPDQCFYITYKDGRHKVWEKIGWRSEHTSQADAVAARADRMRDKSRGMPVDSKARKLTFREAYKKFVELHLSTLKEENNVKYWADKHILPAFGDRAMSGITALDLERFKKDMQKKGMSAQTIKHFLGLIRRVYNRAVKWGIYSGPMPALAVDMPKVDSQRLRFLTPDEAVKLLGKLRARSLFWHDISLISLFTGLRPRDIFRLTGRQINFADGYIDVVESKPGTYTAYFPAIVKDVLASRVGSDKNALLFPSPKTGREVWNVGKPFLKAVEECEFNLGVTDPRFKVVFYTLRHTFASWLAQRDITIQKIAGLMGHSTIQMSERYAKLSPSSLKDAINVLAEHQTTPAAGPEPEKS